MTTKHTSTHAAGSKKQDGKKGNWGVGMALGAMAGIAGAYFLYGTDEGKKRRENIRGWMVQMKGEVMEKMEGMKELDQEMYENVVDTVSKKYRAIKSIDPAELKAIIDDMKGHWKTIKKHLESDGAAVAAGTKDAVKDAAKKISKTKAKVKKAAAKAVSEAEDDMQAMGE